MHQSHRPGESHGLIISPGPWSGSGAEGLVFYFDDRCSWWPQCFLPASTMGETSDSPFVYGFSKSVSGISLALLYSRVPVRLTSLGLHQWPTLGRIECEVVEWLSNKGMQCSHGRCVSLQSKSSKMNRIAFEWMCMWRKEWHCYVFVHFLTGKLR